MTEQNQSVEDATLEGSDEKAAEEVASDAAETTDESEKSADEAVADEGGEG